MPRRREVPKRDILPDPKFGNVEVSKFVNAIMQSGKKSVAERIVYGAFDIITTKAGKRIFREGRSAFDPSYNSATQLVAAGVED